MIEDKGNKTYQVSLFRQLFDGHPAMACMVDLSGKILAVNRSWKRFGEENDQKVGYLYEGDNYLDICVKAAETGDPYAKQALTGILDVLTTGRKKFSMVYPCHSPIERRWFKLWAEPQMPELPVVIIAHQLERAERLTTPVVPGAWD
jgi:hypothetical protein